jgi:NodT family efflux transporter outer membrane factor (OMF) lipoprotein
MSLRLYIVVLSLLSVLASSGCKVGPDYLKPCAPLKEEWSLGNHPKLIGQPADVSQWWNYFNDPQLNYLVHSAYEENLTLREAGMRIEEARHQLNIARGNLGPQTQQVVGSYSKSRTSQNRANIFVFPGSPITLSPGNFLLGFNAAWELDFWGRFRRAIASADAQLDATVENYDDVLVILLGDVAGTYVEMRTLEKRLELARENVKIQSGPLDLTRKKFEVGTISVLDVAQAESNLGQTEALIPALEILRRQASNRLCILLGQPSRDLFAELGMTAKIPDPPVHVASGVPADLLRRRPDVRRAERELAAQSERIGIAQAEFYPHISINGNINLEAQNFGKLFQPESFSGAIVPQFNWNILNYGRIRSNVNLQDATFQRLAYAYRGAVLRADREAEDAMVAYLQGHERVAALSRAVKGANLAVEKVTEQYKAGAVDFNRVFLLQAELVRQQDSLAAAQGDVARSLILLFRAMGGGWEIRMQTEEGFLSRLPPPEPLQIVPANPSKTDADKKKEMPMKPEMLPDGEKNDT